MYNFRKGAIMTNVLMNVENILDTYEEKENIDMSKVDALFLYYKTKKIIKSDYAQKIIQENIVKDKTINNGRYTIKGTRVTPEDIGRIVEIKDNVDIKDVMDEYPSLETKEQVLAGLMFYFKQNITLYKMLFSV